MASIFPSNNYDKLGWATFQDSQPTHAPWQDVFVDLSVSVPILDGSWACYGFWVERNTHLWIIIIMSWKCSFTIIHISLNSNLLTLFGSLISWQYFVPFAATRAFFWNICFFLRRTGRQSEHGFNWSIEIEWSLH